MDFRNKNALITGGFRGIAAAICEEFLQNGIKGVALIDIRDEEPEIMVEWKDKFPSQIVKYFRCDVADEDALKECYKKIIEAFECIEIVVNSAGIANEHQFTKMIDINLTGLIYSSLLALDHMRTDQNGKGGFVINISSVAGLEPIYFTPIYSATKHGVIGFTRSFMNDSYHDKMGIKFLALCPGATATPLLLKEGVTKFYFPEMKEDFKRIMKKIVVQEPSIVAKALIEVLNKEEPRGIWIINRNQLTERKFYCDWSY